MKFDQACLQGTLKHFLRLFVPKQGVILAAVLERILLAATVRAEPASPSAQASQSARAPKL